MPDDLMRLAERCEAATGPDRELDAAVAERVGIKHRSRNGRGREWLADSYGGVETWERHPPRYTAELDAAMTLVPENHAVNIDNGPCHWICLGKQKPMGRVDVKYPKPDYDGEGDSWLTVSAIAATPALALCAAALKAAAALRAKEQTK